MYEDSNRNKISMIRSYLILNYDINDEKVVKLMTIAKSNVDKNSKATPSNTDFSRIYPYIFWQGIKLTSLKHKEHH